MEFNINDAARICYGDEVADRLQEAKDEARYEKIERRRMDAQDILSARWEEAYQAEYKNVPSFWAGSLLIEAINEQERGMNHDDLIVLAYASGDKVAAADELFKMLDWYRVQLATRAADKATNT